ncbi:MAG: hypothetical protein ACPIE8_05920, partial [Henriciella sp.]
KIDDFQKYVAAKEGYKNQQLQEEANDAAFRAVEQNTSRLHAEIFRILLTRELANAQRRSGHLIWHAPSLASTQ